MSSIKEKKPKTAIPAEDERCCEDVAQLLLEGMKGEELAAAVECLDPLIVYVPPPPLTFSVTLLLFPCQTLSLSELPFLNYPS